MRNAVRSAAMCMTVLFAVGVGSSLADTIKFTAEKYEPKSKSDIIDYYGIGEKIEKAYITVFVTVQRQKLGDIIEFARKEGVDAVILMGGATSPGGAEFIYKGIKYVE